MKIYFAGQDNFGNRGCEALIRSNVKTIHEVIPDAEFLVPTNNLAADSKQWPSAAGQRISFINAEPIPESIRWWSRARRIFKFLQAFPPKFSVSQETKNNILNSDALIMTGGDIISLDYGLESLFYWQRICEVAMDAGKPTILWAGSIGPFTALPAVEKLMKSFMQRFSLITVRETATLKYLQSLGINNAKLVTDPAFALDPEAFEHDALSFFTNHDDVIGFNVSPLIRKFRATNESKDDLDDEVVRFLVNVLREKQNKILLIPHVDPLNGSDINSDSAYMVNILNKVKAAGFDDSVIRILPRTLNAAQLKFVISKCKVFMGARTHATVAALSQTVPTTSIAYSIKAKGINNDLFGTIEFVLETPSVTAASLEQHLKKLLDNHAEIKALLKDKMLVWKQDAGKSAALLKELLTKRKE